MKMHLAYAAGALALLLSGCDAGGSANSKATAPGSSSSSSPPAAAAVAAAGQPQGADASDAPVPLVDGKPMWAANRRHTAQENAAYQFGKNGKDFGSGSEADYVAAAHAFTASPPAGVETLGRSNGDRLLYDPKSNTFAVVTKDGAPRTMFKPRGGESYWKEQEDRESARESGDDGGASQG